MGDQFEAFYGGAAGGGKLEPLTNQLVTPTGWTTIGDLKVGDEIFSETGEITRVTKLFDIETPEKAYRLTFDDGSTTDSGSEHRWLTMTVKELDAQIKRTPEWRAARRAKRPSRSTGTKSEKFIASLRARNAINTPPTKEAPAGTVRTTQEIFDTLLDRRGRNNHAIAVAKPLELPDADLPIDPYTLGLWLGDGFSNCGSIGMAEEDWDAISVPYECTNSALRVPDGVKTRKPFLKRTFAELAKLLRENDLINNKHIPDIYLRGSKEQRLALLQGIMDTDGTVCNPAGVEFTNTNWRLSEGVQELIVSLGCKARLIESRAMLYGEDYGPKFDIKWSPTEHVFRLPRKRDKQKLGKSRVLRYRHIVDCQPIAPVPMRCIQVDSPSHLYLTSQWMIPTHNSSCLLMAALEYVDVPGYNALLIRKSYADLAKPGALMDRAHQWLHGTAASWNETKKQWTFPSGATLSFGYLDTEIDKYSYQGAEYSFLGADEITQISESAYTYLFSRVRKLATADIPVRIRAASNPGGVGARWVHDRFIPEGFSPSDATESRVFYKETEDDDGKLVRRAFVPAKLTDNPFLDQDEYRRSLKELDPVTREQLLNGDWQITQRGDIFPMWSEAHHVISWEQFEKLYGVRHIPSHWNRGVFMDCGTTEGHPNVTSWFATAAENSPLAGTVFLYRGQCTYGKTVREIAEHILQYPKSERDKIAVWRMSHEANSERISYNKEFGIPFSPWKADRNRGIAQVRNYFEIRAKNLPHPFKQGIKGRPSLYLISADDQMTNPKDDYGLARWREEIPVYHYKSGAGGDVATQVIPYALFNDAVDTIRAGGAEYFPPTLPLSTEELIQNEMATMTGGRSFDDILNLPSIERGPAIDAYRLKEREVRQRQMNRRVQSGIVRWRRRG